MNPVKKVIAGQSPVEIPTAHKKPIRALAFSPDGRRLASGSDDTTVRLWDIATGKHLAVQNRKPKWAVTLLVFSPDGQQIFSMSRGSQRGNQYKTHVVAWDYLMGQQVESRVNQDGAYLYAMASSSERDRVALAGSTLFLIDPATPEKCESVATLTNHCTAMDFAEGEILTAGGGMCVWKNKKPQRLKPLPVPQTELHAIAWLGGAERWVVTGSDNSLGLWNLVTRTQVKSQEVPDPILQIAKLSADDFATLDCSGKVYRWSAQPLSCLGRIQSRAAITALAASPDGLCLATGDEQGNLCIAAATHLFKRR